MSPTSLYTSYFTEINPDNLSLWEEETENDFEIFDFRNSIYAKFLEISNFHPNVYFTNTKVSSSLSNGDIKVLMIAKTYEQYFVLTDFHENAEITYTMPLFYPDFFVPVKSTDALVIEFCFEIIDKF